MAFDEYLRLIYRAPKHLRAAIIIAFNTGMRTGEIRLLKRSYIDRKDGFMRLPKEVTKENKPKNIPINHHVKSVLDSVPRALKHPYIITYQGKRIAHKDGLRNSFKTACKNAKIPQGRKTENGIIFHDIRRTIKTNMLTAGVDKVHRDLILGHSLHGMDVNYMAPDDETFKQAMEKYTQWIDHQIANIDQSVDQKAKLKN